MPQTYRTCTSVTEAAARKHRLDLTSEELEAVATSDKAKEALDARIALAKQDDERAAMALSHVLSIPRLDKDILGELLRREHRSTQAAMVWGLFNVLEAFDTFGLADVDGRNAAEIARVHKMVAAYKSI